MKLKPLVSLLILLFGFTLVKSQNILDTSSWTIGSGSVSGFTQNGSTSENSREYGTDPFGNSSIIWKATNDSASNPDGGWNTPYHNIDQTKTYRFSVWIKKTNSHSGTTYFGTRSYSGGVHHILRLSDDTVNNNPYFWSGDLPQLNKWYLLVGFVHGSNYTSTQNFGGIYDPVTGNKVSNTIDYKFADTATNVLHRAYLYYDTNTSNRQFFFAPRMEMVDGNEPDIETLLGLNNTDVNILDTSSWTIGCGSVSGFNQNGATAENCRELGRNHVGDEVVLWKAINDSGSNADGGWNTDWFNANHNTSYRFSVWIKKTNSNNGDSYLGFNANNQGSLRLDGTYNSNPYFLVGDLPKLNRWYLVVGYVHKSSYSSTANQGRIYDGVTGEVVANITDYKMKNTVTSLRHRSYLYYSTNTADRQYFWDPRVDAINGSEPTITELLQINEQSELIFSYDLAGNQKQRFYCEEAEFCSPQAPTSKQLKDLKEEEISDPALVSEATLEEDESDNSFRIYPNPTKGNLTVKLKGDNYNLTASVSIYNISGTLVQKVNLNSPVNQLDLDISNMASGTYFLHMHFTNGDVITERIIKN